VETPTNIIISKETKALIDRLLLGRISLAGIARMTQVFEKWLQDYVNGKYAQVPRWMEVSSKKRATNAASR
jgi:insertion element IS1 protein InsB